MGEFWENAFQDKQRMWGEEATPAAIEAAKLFQQQGLNKILIPGFGYGRNAKPFYDRGFEVTGIEISATAIKLARELLGLDIRVFHGSVEDMPFDQELYDGVFCHALIHLLDSDQRSKLLSDCYRQIRPGGIMCFTAITQDASSYSVGEQIGPDRYRTEHGVDLFFYDQPSIQAEFGAFGLLEASKTEEATLGRPVTQFWKILCQKT